MNSRAIFIGMMVLVILPLSLLMGQWSATDPVIAATAIAAIIIIGVVVAMQQSIWLLIPLFYAFRFPLTLLPGGFALRDLVTMGVFVVMVFIWLIRRYEIRVRFGLLEFMLILQMVCLGQAFLRNPIGLAIFRSETVGGRPYFEIVISLIVFVVLGAQVVDLKKVKQAGRFYLFGGIAASGLEIIGAMVPRLGFMITRIYQLGSKSFINSEIGIANGTKMENVNSVGRREYLSYLVKPVFAWLMAVTRPIGLIDIRRPVIVIAFGIVMLAALMSGFRSLLIWIGFMYIAAAIIRHHKVDIVVASMAGILLMALLVGGNGQFFDLPLPVQRTLSFLPGNWDPLAEGDANASANWRYEMWHEVMTTDRYIENKWVGDGFGFSLDDLQFQLQIQMQAVVSSEMMQEHFMRAGQYHSGPIQTINRVGYLGLIILTIGMIVFARYALRIIRRAEETPYYTYAMFIGLPMIVYPLYFYVVIGGYQQAIGMMTFGGGMLRLMENSMDRYETAEN